jgi:hypothetical protein
MNQGFGMNQQMGMNMMQQQYQPNFKQYCCGNGIDQNEFNGITKACTNAYLSKMNPLSTSSANMIKQFIGGEWFVCCSPLGNKNFDFCISSVTGGDFLSFSLDNILFEVCRLK